MAKNLIFRGAATALITPINADGVDFKSAVRGGPGRHRRERTA